MNVQLRIYGHKKGTPPPGGYIFIYLRSTARSFDVISTYLFIYELTVEQNAHTNMNQGIRKSKYANCETSRQNSNRCLH